MDNAQCRMGRAALKWSAAELAKAAGIGYATVARFEAGQTVNDESVAAMRSAMEAGGVEFIAPGAVVKPGKSSAGGGVRFKRP